jgi:hypothetical protein
MRETVFMAFWLLWMAAFAVGSLWTYRHPFQFMRFMVATQALPARLIGWRNQTEEMIAAAREMHSGQRSSYRGLPKVAWSATSAIGRLVTGKPVTLSMQAAAMEYVYLNEKEEGGIGDEGGKQAWMVMRRYVRRMSAFCTVFTGGMFAFGFIAALLGAIGVVD